MGHAASHRRVANPILNQVRSFSGFMRGPRLGEWICYRSRLERDALGILEFEPQVLRIERNDLSDLECEGLRVVREQGPYRIVTPLGKYTPDLRVTLSDRVAFLEIGDAGTKGGRDRAKLLAARAAIEHDGYAFVILTEREIRSGHRAENCRLLLAHLLALGPSELDVAYTRRLLHTRTTIGEAAQVLRTERKLDEALAFAVIWHTVALAAHDGRLVFDLDNEVLDVERALSITPRKEEEVVAEIA